MYGPYASTYSTRKWSQLSVRDPRTVFSDRSTRTIGFSQEWRLILSTVFSPCFMDDTTESTLVTMVVTPSSFPNTYYFVKSTQTFLSIPKSAVSSTLP